MFHESVPGLVYIERHIGIARWFGRDIEYSRSSSAVVIILTKFTLSKKVIDRSIFTSDLELSLPLLNTEDPL